MIYVGCRRLSCILLRYKCTIKKREKQILILITCVRAVLESYSTPSIPNMKKAAKGDMNVLADYPALMEKAEEFGSKMENTQDDMSASQWSRFMKITNKKLTAIQQMN